MQRNLDFGSEADAPIINATELTKPGGKIDPDELRARIEEARGQGQAMPRVQFGPRQGSTSI